jgi:hypothetical protein
VFENRVLWIIFEPKREKVAGDWRTMLNEELHNIFASLNVVIAINLRTMMGHVAFMGDMKDAYIFVG